MSSVRIPINPESRRVNSINIESVDHPDFIRFRMLAGHYTMLARIQFDRKRKYGLRALWLVPVDRFEEFNRLRKQFLKKEEAGMRFRYFPRGKRSGRQLGSRVEDAHSFAFYIDTRCPKQQKVVL